MPSNDGILSLSGEAVMLTPFEVNFSTKFGSLGVYVLNTVPSDKIPSILLPLIST